MMEQLAAMMMAEVVCQILLEQAARTAWGQSDQSVSSCGMK